MNDTIIGSKTHSLKRNNMTKYTFSKKRLHARKEPKFAGLTYLKSKASFWIAAFALIAFVTGNMIGQHGMYAFLSSVVGEFDSTMLTYSGTVSPLQYVPDYQCWAQYGGNVEQGHTYRELPEKCKVALPKYDITSTFSGSPAAQTTYSVPYMGGYDADTEGKGSHLAVDIRAPQGTPVFAVMDGMVTNVKEDKGGFGYFIVIKHYAPDPENASVKIDLFSAYAHLSAQFVQEGQLVKKNELIGAVGMTGNASGPHLHFQIDRTADWHPFWPFTSAEAKKANLTFMQAINTGLNQQKAYQYTINPMMYVQTHEADTKNVIQASSTPASTQPQTSVPQIPAVNRTPTDRRRSERLARLQARMRAVDNANASTSRSVQNLQATAQTDTEIAPIPASASTQASMPSVVSSSTNDAAIRPVDIRFETDEQFSNGERKILTVRLLDATGNAIARPLLNAPIFLTTAYGQATFTREKLTAEDFVSGSATVYFTPTGSRTVVIKSLEFPTLSNPLRYARQ